MEKKYIIAVVIVIALWAGFMGYRHLKKKEADQAHRKDTYSRMVEMAKKSPRAGLSQMARALKVFFADNKTYPSRLEDLYPRYIDNKAFIDELDWNYEPGDDDFYLSKSIELNNRTMVASIDSSLRSQIETGSVKVAATKAAPKKRQQVEVLEEAYLEYEEAIAEGTVIEVLDEQQMTVKETDVVLAAVNPELKREEISSRTERINVQRELSRIVSSVGSEAISERDTEIGYNLERYLVWKGRDGAIGVGNVQFPDREDSMLVAVRNRWYSVKRRPSKKEASAGPAEKVSETINSGVSADTLAAGYSGQYLVWKDEGDVIGFGNVQYPEKEYLVVASSGEWNTLERPSLPETRAEALQAADIEKHSGIDEIAANISKEYLVWKDKNGVIGIGDTQYPKKERLVVASGGDWTVLKEQPLPESSRKAQEAGSGQKPAALKPVAAGFSGQYLVWKDKQGRIGFGNVQYPELQNVAYVHNNDNWQKIVN